MSTYLMQEALPAEAWAAILDGKMNPHPLGDSSAMAEAMATIGGKLLGVWLSLASCELVFLVELPGDVEAAACSLKYFYRSRSGPIRITSLLGPADAVAAIARASSLPRPYAVAGVDR